MRRTLRAAFAAMIAAGAVVAGGGVVASAAPSGCNATDNGIYNPPASVTGGPGTLLACESTSLPGVPGANAKAWKIQYASTDVAGKLIAVSGFLAVPNTSWSGTGSRPLIAFNPGTLGMANKCALSRQLTGANQDQYEGANIAAILNKGFAVMSTDGVGYLNGQTHPYVVGADSAHALLDGTRRAFQVPGADLSSSTKVGIWGYSEGGAASLWATQLAASYAPELNIVGDASGGVPGDLKATASALNGGAFAGFLADAVVGLAAAYPAMPFDQLLNDTGRSAVQKVKSDCLISTVLDFMGANISNYTTDHLTLDQIYALKGTDGRTWSRVVDDQKLGVNIGTGSSSAKYRVNFPVFQYRGIAEEVIPTATEDATHEAYCQAGITTQWGMYPGDHLLTDSEAQTDVLNWMGDRFAGTPTTGNC